MKIAVDAGHGGKDPGATNDNLFEKDIVLDVAKKLKVLLSDNEHEVVMTRDSDEYIGLTERAKIANDFSADVFVSIHCNAAGTKQASGTETLHYRGSQNGKKLAEIIQTKLIEKLDRKDRGLKPRTNLAVLNKTKMPAVLVEMAFITNQTEKELLQSDEFKQSAAEAIFEGVEKYAKERS